MSGPPGTVAGGAPCQLSPRTVSHSAQRWWPPISPPSMPLESVDPSACLAWPCADRDTTLRPCSWELEVKRTRGAGLWFRDWPSRGALAGLPGPALTCSLIRAQRQPGCLPPPPSPLGRGRRAPGTTGVHPQHPAWVACLVSRSTAPGPQFTQQAAVPPRSRSLLQDLGRNPWERRATSPGMPHGRSGH